MSLVTAATGRLRAILGSLKYRLSEGINDRRRSVTTRGLEMPPDFVDAGGCHPYLALSYPAIDRVFGHLAVRPGHDVFVDIGSGLGRVVLQAAEHAFKTVIGVEYSADLQQRAVTNAQTLRRSRIKCHDIRMIQADAREYPFADDITVVFFYMPFSSEILGKCLDNLRLSVVRAPRDVTVLYTYPVGGEVTLHDMNGERPWLRIATETMVSSTAHLIVAEVSAT